MMGNGNTGTACGVTLTEIPLLGDTVKGRFSCFGRKGLLNEIRFSFILPTSRKSMAARGSGTCGLPKCSETVVIRYNIILKLISPYRVSVSSIALSAKNTSAAKTGTLYEPR